MYKYDLALKNLITQKYITSCSDNMTNSSQYHKNRYVKQQYLQQSYFKMECCFSTNLIISLGLLLEFLLI